MFAYLLLRGALGVVGVLLVSAIVWWARWALVGMVAACLLLALLRAAVRRRRRRRAAFVVGTQHAQQHADREPDTVIVSTTERPAVRRAYARGVNSVLPGARVVVKQPGGAHRAPEDPQRKDTHERQGKDRGGTGVRRAGGRNRRPGGMQQRQQ